MAIRIVQSKRQNESRSLSRRASRFAGIDNHAVRYDRLLRSKVENSQTPDQVWRTIAGSLLRGSLLILHCSLRTRDDVGDNSLSVSRERGGHWHYDRGRLLRLVVEANR